MVGFVDRKGWRFEMPAQASDAPRIVIHIGTHKTGTSAFQKYLSSHKHDLLELGVAACSTKSGGRELGLLVVREELNFPLRASHPDTTLLEHRTKQRRQLATFLDESEGAAVLVFSHEALSFVRDRAETRRLKDLFGPGANITIVLVTRSPERYLRSWKHELQRQGFASESKYVRSFMYTEPDSWLVDYEELVRVYAAEFGEKNVISIDYEEQMAICGSIVPALMETCGIARESLPPGWGLKQRVSDPTRSQLMKRAVYRFTSRIPGLANWLGQRFPNTTTSR